MLTLQSAITFVNQRQASIRSVLIVLLSVYLLAYLAELTWRVTPSPQNPGAISPSSANTSNRASQASINIARIKQLNLFGPLQQQPPAAVEQDTVTDAPETRLNLTLTGVVASTIEANGAAIIENRGSQQTYGIGEKIEGTNASLRQVFSDRVIIRNGARDETLMLDGVDFAEANKRRAAAPPTVTQRPAQSSQSNRPTLSEEAISATRELRAQPAKFTDFLSISPAQSNGQLLGYRVQPGKNPALFEAAGLQTGDIISEINGLDVTDPQQAREAMGELRSADALQLTVLRDEQYLTLYLDLPDASDDQ